MPKLRTKTYEITDPKLLFDTHPHLFQVVPDHSKIKKAHAAGFKLPGCELILTPIENKIKEMKDAEDASAR